MFSAPPKRCCQDLAGTERGPHPSLFPHRLLGFRQVKTALLETRVSMQRALPGAPQNLPLPPRELAKQQHPVGVS